MKTFLNLGCGNRLKKVNPGETGVKWINIDYNSSNPEVMNLDLRQSLPFEMNSIDFIYTSHLIEHFTPYEWAAIRKDWYRVLGWGCDIEIHCPDLEAACRMFLNGEKSNKYHGIVPFHDMIYGSQENIGQMHHQGFDKERLKMELLFEGFREVIVYNSNGVDDWELTCRARK